MRLVLAFAFAALAACAQPRTLLDQSDFERIGQLARSSSWAAGVRDGILSAADGWQAAHLARFGLREWALPPEGGQWSHWYVCPTHGLSLTYRPPNEHLCPRGHAVTGDRYDRVIYSRRNSDNAAGARDNALAYRFTGKIEYARAAARILLAYAGVYGGWPIHDTTDRIDWRTGGRAFSQTLDESVWLIPMTWAYDLIADSGVLNAEQRRLIENDLLRAAVAVIERNDAGKSNWQSWHNAAIGAVGFALGDQELIARAIGGKSGFRFQMRESVFEEGFWYEGAWGYHFYALDPLLQLAEMAFRNGIDLFAELSLRKMFEAPLRFALPDGSLPQFNDSGSVNVFNYDRFYEAAYHRYEDPLFLSVLGRRARGREALFWGKESVEGGTRLELASEVFPVSGNAILRAPGSDHTIAFKFGPHGGGHGHYDKLNFISYALGGIMAVDPGTQPYGAPTHNTWDKMTVAHNTVVVDEQRQAEATGALLAFASEGPMTAVRANAGPAYRQASLVRTLFLTPEYAVDHFAAQATDGAEHAYDWVYHNYGRLSPAFATQPYDALPKTNGYQHLTGAAAASPGGDWEVIFDMNAGLLGNFGSIYVNKPEIRATYQYSRDLAYSGNFSGKASADFSAAEGYALFSTPVLSGQPQEKPAGLRVMVYGDGSGHRLALRLNDSAGERFVYTVGAVDWTGWREIEAASPEEWTHYLGNNDGVFDPPVRTVSIELTYVSGGPRQTTLYVDDIAIGYPEQGWVAVADFERQLRSLRLRMLGAPATTVVTGDGLGPNLNQPVPFVMARRKGREARFVAVLEPFAEKPRITGFRETAPGEFEVTAAGFTDRFTLDAGGNLRFERTPR